ncbi:MAG: hypothetical protein Q9M26_03690 [Mariprofundales bacterium]|nr:hypothetical protein [Mariprofundales bacterium]
MPRSLQHPLYQALKAFTHIGNRVDRYYWRTKDGMEVDLLILLNGVILPVEYHGHANTCNR